MNINENTLHEVPFQGSFTHNKNTFIKLNRSKNETEQEVFCDSWHSLPRLGNVKNSSKTNA